MCKVNLKRWIFNTADFSVQASSGGGARGSVTLIRIPEDKERWHRIVRGTNNESEWPPLYAHGMGVTLAEAIADAEQRAIEADKSPLWKGGAT